MNYQDGLVSCETSYFTSLIYQLIGTLIDTWQLLGC